MESLLHTSLAISTRNEVQDFRSARKRNLSLLCYRKQPSLGISAIEEAQSAALAGLKVCFAVISPNANIEVLVYSISTNTMAVQA